MMRRILGVTIVASAISAFLLVEASRLSAEPVPAGDPNASAAGAMPRIKEIDDAVERFKQRDFDGALKLLKEGAKNNPDLPPAEVIMAQLFSSAGVPQGVRNYLEETVKASPADPEAYLLMGDIAMRERRVTEAEMLFQKAGSLMAGFDKIAKRKEALQPRILKGVAEVSEARGDWPAAQKQLEAWLKVEPKSSLALQRLGRCLFQQKDAAGALAKLKEAAKIDPSMLTPEAVLAQFYDQAGDRENAKKWMEAALAAAPKDLNTRRVAGEWYLAIGQIKDAETHATAAVQIDSKSLDAKILRGVVALFQKDYSTAEHYFEAARLQAPKNFAASNNLALVLIEQKDDSKRKRALDYAESNMQQFGKSKEGVEAASTLGWVLYRMGKLDEAEKYLQAAMSSGGFNPDTAYYFAKLCVDENRQDQAKQLVDAALKSTGPFLMRDKAEELAEQLKK